MLPHDLKFYNYKKAFGEIHHPENTKFVNKYSFLGAFDSQRVMYKETYPQGCDYIVGEIREYRGTQESIKAFYAKQKIMLGQKEKGISVNFIGVNQYGRIDRNEWTKYGPSGLRLLQDLDLSLFTSLDPTKSYYFVSVWYLEFSKPERDIRCLL
jgi:hypothetical protein